MSLKQLGVDFPDPLPGVRRLRRNDCLLHHTVLARTTHRAAV